MNFCRCEWTATAVLLHRSCWSSGESRQLLGGQFCAGLSCRVTQSSHCSRTAARTPHLTTWSGYHGKGDLVSSLESGQRRYFSPIPFFTCARRDDPPDLRPDSLLCRAVLTKTRHGSSTAHVQWKRRSIKSTLLLFVCRSLTIRQTRPCIAWTQ